MYDNDDEKGPFLKLRKHHQALADELRMTTLEYLEYRKEIDKTEEQRISGETPLIALKISNCITLIDNIDDLGYSKQFLTREDAEFLFDKVQQWEKDNSYMVGIDEEESIELERDEIVSTYVATGVKYDFKKQDISI